MKLLVAAATIGLAFPLAQAQTSFKGWNPTWSVVRNGAPYIGNDSASRNALKQDVINGVYDTRGTQVNVPNSSVEQTTTGNRSPMSNSQLRWHNPFGTDFNNPTSSRWYQKDGNTQVFRVFPGDENLVGTRRGAGRSEAFAYNLKTRYGDGMTMTFSARYRVAASNGSRDVKIFQSKADGSRAWGVALWIRTNGDIDIVKRKEKKEDWVYIDTGYRVGQSFNLRVTDDGKNYKVYINNVLKASDSWDRQGDVSACRWGAYVQGGSQGVLTGSVSNPTTVYVSGARVTRN